MIDEILKETRGGIKAWLVEEMGVYFSEIGGKDRQVCVDVVSV